ncbi:TetR/AcrR family transcriptional regulator [Sphingobium aromaticivastans]|uniref:TetR/AcrR family transcriptional regulator n=1 Tax=Sphingobium aromaticivastans TaxID=1778665 RepID=UPI0030183019
MLSRSRPASSIKTPSRASNWQAERRAETRRRLLDAAAQTFGTSGYVGTRVEDILTVANVGRTSFYKHFRDRLDIASELFTEFMPRLGTFYLSILDSEQVDLSTVMAWIDRLADAYAVERGVMRLFAEVMAIEPGFSATISQVQLGIMRQLGARFDAFQRAVDAGEGALHTRAVLVIESIDHVCSLISLRQAPIDRATAIRFAAEAFIAFVEGQAEHISDT